MSRPCSMIGRGLVAVIALAAAACGGPGGAANVREIQRVKTATMSVVLLSTEESLRQGKGTLTIEFRNISDDRPVDVGDVRGSASMTMAGTPMLGSFDVQRTSTPGRYTVNSEFSMAGRWRLTVEWNGPAGKDSVSFAGTVR